MDIWGVDILCREDRMLLSEEMRAGVCSHITGFSLWSMRGGHCCYRSTA